jgi:NADPH-dependent curcumin reductase CurA
MYQFTGNLFWRTLCTSSVNLGLFMQVQQWLYQQAPITVVGPEHYALRTVELDPTLHAGEVLIAARWISVDPYMRINQASGDTWMPPHPLNTVQGAAVVAQVLSSRAEGFAANDWVLAYSGWQTAAKLHYSALTKIDASIAPPQSALGVLGMPGRTAWFGLTEAGQVRAGDVVVVSGAAGAVGSLVVQFAKRHGAKVLAMAGSADKCAWLQTKLGADWALNYRDFSSAEALSAAIKALCGGVDVYFDNVGGTVSDAVLPLINLRARIVICGQMSQYNGALDVVELGPRFLHHVLYQRATIQGILARDYTHRMDEMRRIVAPWVQAGEIVVQECILEGFEQLPHALNQLFNAAQRGKVMVRVC